MRHVADPVLDGADGRHLLAQLRAACPWDSPGRSMSGYWKTISGRSVASAMRLKCASAICGDWPSVKGAGGNTSRAEAPPSAAMRAMRAASRLPSAQMPLTSGSAAADLVLRDLQHAALLLEGAGGDLGGMRVDGDGGDAAGGGHVAQVLAEARLVDGQVRIEGQQHGRDDAVGNVSSCAVPCVIFSKTETGSRYFGRQVLRRSRPTGLCFLSLEPNRLRRQRPALHHLGQLALQDLAAGGQRELRHRQEILGHVVPGEALAAEMGQQASAAHRAR